MLQDLDRIDRRILSALQRDGRISNQTLADEVGLSPSACLRRVRRLEDDGVIAGYVALLDPDVIGRGQTAFVEITLDSQRENAIEAFEQAVLDCPGVMSCHLMTGDADYLVRLVIGSMDDYEHIHRHHLTRLPHVARIQSSFAIRTVTNRTVHDLPD